MDNVSIACFLRVCELGNFTKAAEELHISQSALSRRIAALEDEIGIKLLDRSKTGISISAGGTIFYKDAKRIAEFEAEAKDKIRKYKAGLLGTVTVGYCSHDYLKPLVFAARSMKTAHPEVVIDFKESPRAQILYSFERKAGCCLCSKGRYCENRRLSCGDRCEKHAGRIDPKGT